MLTMLYTFPTDGNKYIFNLAENTTELTYVILSVYFKSVVETVFFIQHTYILSNIPYGMVSMETEHTVTQYRK